ncbi:protein lplB [Paenibacillus sp. MY03]|jgi:putative aldouronate transport system permease protein|uniref:ABC transporter permease n=1 Tax=Paenibacillus TaxID=44249 RepID=UPI000B3C850E|nr:MULTISPECIES: ABC transporter permease subunit [Paenibacillus]OUS70592.1 protein lplB [Paenibacillus sp. MY03]
MYSLKILRRNLPLHLMILPGLLLIVIFSYVPMAGLYIAFQRFIPAKGFFGDQQWIGWDNFRYMLDMPGIYGVLWNTVFIAGMKMLAGLIVPITVALLLNELRSVFVKRSVQTLIYLPHFLSWIILSGVLIDILSPSSGIVNQFLGSLGLKPVFFLGNNDWFPFTIVLSDVWKEFGFATIVYIAALSGIDPQLYEAAIIDGANRWRQTWHVTLPGMRMIIVLMSVLSMGNILNAGFDQIVNLYSTQVYASGDIIDTLVYRIGLQQAQYGVATAVGLFKSVVSFLFISVAYYAAYKLANYRIF